MIRLGVPADLLAHPEYLILGPEGLAEGRTYVAEEAAALVGFATWNEAGGTIELEDLFVDPNWRRRGVATALVNRIADVLPDAGCGAPGGDRQPARAGVL